jgi:hypothetical protein
MTSYASSLDQDKIKEGRNSRFEIGSLKCGGLAPPQMEGAERIMRMLGTVEMGVGLALLLGFLYLIIGWYSLAVLTVVVWWIWPLLSTGNISLTHEW